MFLIGFVSCLVLGPFVYFLLGLAFLKAAPKADVYRHIGWDNNEMKKRMSEDGVVMTFIIWFFIFMEIAVVFDIKIIIRVVRWLAGPIVAHLSVVGRFITRPYRKIWAKANLM